MTDKEEQKMKISKLMSLLAEKQQELGDLEFEVHMPVIGSVSYDLALQHDNTTHKPLALVLIPNPDVNQLVDAILNGGQEEKPPCKTCDMTDCPKHPTKLN